MSLICVAQNSSLKKLVAQKSQNVFHVAHKNFEHFLTLAISTNQEVSPKKINPDFQYFLGSRGRGGGGKGKSECLTAGSPHFYKVAHPPRWHEGRVCPSPHHTLLLPITQQGQRPTSTCHGTGSAVIIVSNASPQPCLPQDRKGTKLRDPCCPT